MVGNVKNFENLMVDFLNFSACGKNKVLKCGLKMTINQRI